MYEAKKVCVGSRGFVRARVVCESGNKTRSLALEREDVDKLK